MKSGQRVIKYLAIALAIFIIVSIVSAVLLSFNIFSDFLGLTKEKERENIAYGIKNEEIINKEFENTGIKSIKIELAYSKLAIKEGENFKVETNTNRIESRQVGNKLEIKEKASNLFLKDENRIVNITIPKDTVLDIAKIETGAGEINIEKLSTKELDLEIGAGKVTIQNLDVIQSTKIEGGAGKVEIKSGNIANLDLDMGAGNFILNTVLTGNNKVDAGIGRLEFNLTNGLENYTIRAQKGIGSIKIDNKEVTDNVEYGKGETRLKIDGGVGHIEIK